MIRDLKLLAKMFIDGRAFKGRSEFRFRPRLFDRDVLMGVDIEAEGKTFTAWMRRGTTDASVFSQVFLNNDYNLRRFPPHYDRIIRKYNEMSEPLILDLGANVGLSTLYFIKNFGRARVVALEPDADNCRVLHRNVGGMERVMAVNAAIASRDGQLDVIKSDDGEWKHRTGGLSDTGRTPAMSVRSILDMFPKAQPFIAKIDIEGAEAELFSGDAGWIDQFPVIIIEVHDWMLPGQSNSRNFIKSIANADRDFLIHEENVISIANT